MIFWLAKCGDVPILLIDRHLLLSIHSRILSKSLVVGEYHYVDDDDGNAGNETDNDKSVQCLVHLAHHDTHVGLPEVNGARMTQHHRLQPV